MSESPTTIIPEYLMIPSATAGVMQFLQRCHMDSKTKRGLLRAWAQEVGVKLSASQVRAVSETGVDCGGPTPWR